MKESISTPKAIGALFTNLKDNTKTAAKGIGKGVKVAVSKAIDVVPTPKEGSPVSTERIVEIVKAKEVLGYRPMIKNDTIYFIIDSGSSNASDDAF